MEIFECGDHREFLRNYLSSRKSAVGLRTLARKAGFKSPGHVTMLINGQRRLTARSAELLAQGIGLKGRRRALLLAFAHLDMAKTEKEKSRIREEIYKLKSFQPEFQLSAKQYSFLATWYYPILLTMLHMPTIPQEPAFLAQRLGRGVTPAAVARALNDFIALRLVRKNGSGRLEPSNAALTTPEDVQDFAIEKYHRNSLKLAEEGLELARDEREFNGLTVTIPLRVLPRVKEKIRQLRSELNEMLAQENDAADVYQINLHLFPVTRGCERKET